MRLRSSLAAAALVVAAPFIAADAASASPAPAPAGAQPADADTDADGLSDFDEVHKYLTDPAKPDTDGDGVPDGDWDERREYAYSVRTLVAAMPPATAVQDGWQDARVLDRTDDSVEIEIVAYPYATPDASIPDERDWRAKAAALAEWTKPNLTANWDDAMRAKLVAEMKEAGIDPDELGGRGLVQQAAMWALARTNEDEKCFTTHFIEAKDGKVVVRPGLEEAFAAGRKGAKRTDEQQIAHEALGRSMFTGKERGSCTSSAVYLETVLRALGVPSRLTIAIPPADASDRLQLDLLRDGIHHGPLQKTVLKGAGADTGAYVSHTFLEVFVGGRWRRLNYEKLPQPVADPRYLGLMLRVMTIDDLATSGLAATWGKRYALHEKSARFPGANPYRVLSVSDRVGAHAKFKLEQPAPRRDHAKLTIVAAQWDPQRVQGGKLLDLICTEWFEEDDGDQYKRFTSEADLHFVFRAEGQPDVEFRGLVGSLIGPGVHAVGALVPDAAWQTMKPGVAYAIVPKNENPKLKWAVKDGLTIAR